MTLAASILDWLFGLTRVSWSDPRAAIGWRSPLPLWGWVLIFLGAIVVGVWSYQSLLGARPAHVALGVVRALLVALVAALIVGPMLVVNQELTDPDVLLVLVDQSASMDVKDMPPAGSSGGGAASGEVSRTAALEAALAQHQELFSDKKLGRDRDIIWLGFAGDTYRIDPFNKDAKPPPLSERQATALRTAIEHGLQAGAGRPISGMVVFTDGRSPQATGAAVVQRLQQQAVSVFAVPLGAKTLTVNLAVGQVEAPEKAFINDDVPVTVWLEHYPEDARVDSSRITVRLVDSASGKTLDEKHPSDDMLREPVRLSASSPTVGPAPWRVELVYEPGPASTSPVLVTRAQQELSPELVDQPIRVLYVEGYPRWEFRYLKNMLIREKSLKSSTMLISADRAFAQEGQLPITRVPITAEEFKPYDVIIIGDVPAGYFSSDQLRLMSEQVSARGAGMLWIGGSNDTPRSYDGTPLSGLMPMRSASSVGRIDPSLGALAMRPTPLAEALQVLRLRSLGGERSASESLWPSDLPPLLWAQNLGELKPSAEVLATSPPIAGHAYPLVTRMRYGAGQSLYVGTDETWRWRFGRGELYFEQFWMQLVRMLGRSRLQQGNDRATLALSGRRLEVGQTAVVTLRINDELLSQRELPRISVSVFRADAEPGVIRSDGTVKQDVAVEKIELLPVSAGDSPSGAGGPKEYRATWRPTISGRLTLRVAEPALEDLAAAQAVDVVRPDDERRQPAPDRDRLTTLAEQTGGKVLALDQLDELTRLVPNRARRTPNDIREPLWNSYLAFALVLLLLTAEWVGRKVIRLV